SRALPELGANRPGREIVGARREQRMLRELGRILDARARQLSVELTALRERVVPQRLQQILRELVACEQRGTARTKRELERGAVLLPPSSPSTCSTNALASPATRAATSSAINGAAWPRSSASPHSNGEPETRERRASSRRLLDSQRGASKSSPSRSANRPACS